MKIVIDIPEEMYKNFQKRSTEIQAEGYLLENSVLNGIPMPDNTTNGKEILIKYCLEHSGEEIYDLLKQVFDASMSWTDSRGYIIDWLEKGGK